MAENTISDLVLQARRCSPGALQSDVVTEPDARRCQNVVRSKVHVGEIAGTLHSGVAVSGALTRRRDVPDYDFGGAVDSRITNS